MWIAVVAITRIEEEEEGRSITLMMSVLAYRRFGSAAGQ